MHLSALISKEQLQFLYEGYCSMPLLWTGIYSGLTQFELPLVAYSLQEGVEIKQNKRLGKLAEDLFSQWLLESKQYDVVFENLQIIEGKRTLGEIDVMLFDTKLKNYIHLELVTKFYLYNPAYKACDIRAWVGPNRNDSLAEKVAKLSQKQLPLLHQKFTQQVLKSYLSSTKNIIQQVLFKANLFVPLNTEVVTGELNKQCVVGNYVTFSEFHKLHTIAKRYYCPTKQDWLRHPKTQKSWYIFEEIIPQVTTFMKQKQSLMVWVKYNETYQRYIVVPYEHF